MVLKRTYICDINLGETVDVTDPCYGAKVWCRMKLQGVLPDTYKCYAYVCEKPEEDAGLVMIAQIVNIEQEYEAEELIAEDLWEEAGDIGVDAGCAGFFANKPDFSDDEWADLCNYMSRADKEGAQGYTMTFGNGSDGFWTSSGYGDGGYDVYVVKNNDGKIIAAEIRF